MKKASIRLLFKSFTPKGTIGFVMNTLQSVFSDLFFGALYLLVFDHLIQDDIPPVLVVLSLVFVTTYFVFGIPLWGRWMESCGNAYKAKLSEYIFNNALKYHADTHSGAILSLLQHDVERASQISGWSLAVLFQAVISGLVSSVIIGLVSWKLLISLLLIGAVPVVLNLFCAKKMRGSAKDIRALIDEKLKRVVDLVNNIVIVKVYKYDDIICRKILDTARDICEKEIQTHTIKNVTAMIDDLFFSAFFKAVVLVYGMQLVIKDEISIGSLLLCFSMVEGIAFFMSYIGGYIRDLQRILVSVQRVDGLAQEEELMKSGISHVSDKITDIIFDNVSFKYQDDGFVFENLSLSLHFPGYYMITGKNGCGKSTFLKLILGLYLPNDGDIRIKCDHLTANRLCYVSQRPLVFSGTICDNIRVNCNSVSDLDIMQALHCVSLSEWVKGLDAGLCFKIEESGNNISKGQKMRICIARALVQHPQLLILDEPDANLDKQTMKQLMDSIDRDYDCSIILVSHTLDKIMKGRMDWKQVIFEP